MTLSDVRSHLRCLRISKSCISEKLAEAASDAARVPFVPYLQEPIHTCVTLSECLYPKRSLKRWTQHRSDTEETKQERPFWCVWVFICRENTHDAIYMNQLSSNRCTWQTTTESRTGNTWFHSVQLFTTPVGAQHLATSIYNWAE